LEDNFSPKSLLLAFRKDIESLLKLLLVFTICSLLMLLHFL